MPRPDAWLSCPESVQAWRFDPRRQAGRPDRLTAVCPSCGHGLVLRLVDGKLELIPPRIGSPAPGHQLRKPGPLVLL